MRRVWSTLTNILEIKLDYVYTILGTNIVWGMLKQWQLYIIFQPILNEKPYASSNIQIRFSVLINLYAEILV